jgi:hypothetical protein
MRIAFSVLDTLPENSGQDATCSSGKVFDDSGGRTRDLTFDLSGVKARSLIEIVVILAA